MKVLFPFVGDSVGGSHRSTIELIKGLKAEDIEVQVLLHQDQGPLSSVLNSEKIAYEHVPATNLAGTTPRITDIAKGILSNLFRFRRYIENNSIDIVHGNDLRINLSWSLATKASAKKYIWHQRTLLSASPLWRLISVLSHFFIAISDQVLLSAPSNLPQSKKQRVWNPIVADKVYDKNVIKKQLCEQYSIPDEAPLIGYIGRLVDYKNVDFIIQCLAQYNKSADNKLHFVIIGTGKDDYMRELEAQVKNLGMAQSVTFTGFVYNPQELVAGVDVLVAASSIDAFGRSLVEAMLQKVPVLASAIGGHLDVIQNQQNGYLFELGNSADFMDKLQRLFNISQATESITETAYKQASIQYSVQNHVSEILAIYQRLVAG